MALLHDLERKELFGVLRAIPVRLIPALTTSVLLYLSGDMIGLWPLSWLALVPLCVACRGAGIFSAYVLAFCAFAPAVMLQSYWLLDVPGLDISVIWLPAVFLPPIAFAAMEAPILRVLPWLLRPILMAVLATGFWALLPFDAEFLIPLGGMIDSEFLRIVQPKLGLAGIAGIFTGIGWLAAEGFWRGRKPERPAFLVACGVVTLLCSLAAIDWTSVNFVERSAGNGDRIKMIVAAGDDPAAQTRDFLDDEPERAVVLWRVRFVDGPKERAKVLSQAAGLTISRNVVVVLVLDTPVGREGYFYGDPNGPPRIALWDDDSPDQKPLIAESIGNLKLFPRFRRSEHWSTQWDLDLYAVAPEPAHPAQARFWVREARRAARIRGVRTAIVWEGGGALINVDGDVVAETESGEVISGELFAGGDTGEAVGHPRLRVLERIFANSAPIVSLMLVLLTPIVWLKRRRRARPTDQVAIEEVFDESSTLTKDQTDTITRRFQKPEDE